MIGAALSALVALAVAVWGLSVMLGLQPGRRRRSRAAARPSLLNWLVFVAAVVHLRRRDAAGPRPYQPPTLPSPRRRRRP